MSDTSINPRDIKRDLARDLVSRYYDENKAKKAEDAFDQIFIKKDIPDDIPTLTIDTDSNIIDVLVSQNLVSSKAEAKRLITQNAIKIDGEVCNDPAYVLKKSCGELVIKVGKRRFLRVLG